jgi:curved DNA-binding protein CbpA
MSHPDSETTFDPYIILQIPHDASLKVIKKAYKKLARTHHPDRGGDEVTFEIINHAFSLLTDEVERAKFDKFSKMVAQTKIGHDDLKLAASDFLGGQDEAVTEEQKAAAMKLYEDEKARLNAKMGLFDETELSKADTTKRIHDMELEREQHDIDNAPPPIFEGDHFNAAQFNEAFEKMYKDPRQMVARDSNPMGYNADDGFAGLDDIGHAFAETPLDPDTDMFASIDLGPKAPKFMTKDDVAKLSGSTKMYNEPDVDLIKKMKEELLKRSDETDLFNARKMTDFDTGMDMGGYGMSHAIGIKEAEDLKYLDYDDVDDIKEKMQHFLDTKELKETKEVKKTKKHKHRSKKR